MPSGWAIDSDCFQRVVGNTRRAVAFTAIGLTQTKTGMHRDARFSIPQGLPAADLAASLPVHGDVTVELGALEAPLRERFFVPVAA